VRRPEGFDERAAAPARGAGSGSEHAGQDDDTGRRGLAARFLRGRRATLSASGQADGAAQPGTDDDDGAARPGTDDDGALEDRHPPVAVPARSRIGLPDLPPIDDLDALPDMHERVGARGEPAARDEPDVHERADVDEPGVPERADMHERADRPDVPSAGASASASEPTASASARPVGAGVRAAETAREARAARKRRRLMERAEVRRFTRRSRHRRAAWITSGVVVLVLVLSVVVAVYSPLMALTRVEVKGNERIDRSQVVSAVQDQMGTPLARIDFAEIERRLAGFPLIESYVTEEAPPHTLVITITERKPILAVQTGSGYDLVDPAGIVVESDPKLPEGMPVAKVSPSQIGGSAYRSMAEVVLSLPTTIRSSVTEATATTSDDVTLTLASGARVVWGSPDDSDSKATLLAALIADHEARSPGTVVEYDVSAPDNGIIRNQG